MKKSDKYSENLLKDAFDALSRWENDKLNLDECLDDLKSAPDMRKAVSHLLFSYFRNKGVVDGIVRRLAKSIKPKFRRLLAVTLTQGFFQDGISGESAANIAVYYAKRRFGPQPAKFINASLRNALGTTLEAHLKLLEDWERRNLPQLIFERWKRCFGMEAVERLSELIKERPPLTIKFVDEPDVSLLEKLDLVPLTLDEWAKDQAFYIARPEKIFNADGLVDASIYVQDPSTSLAIALTGDADIRTLVDLCAAPGGKFLSLMKKYPTAKGVASDISPRRQKRTCENLSRFPDIASRSNVMVASGERTPFKSETFDLVFLDVPCSNTGVFRHRPDALWTFSKEKITELNAKQFDMLTHSSKLVNQGGMIVYSTCSIENEENHDIVAKFLEARPEFTILREQTLLPSRFHDGGYACVISWR